MTDAQWQACASPRDMLWFLIKPSEPRVTDIESFPDCIASDRKLRLFACACYHRIQHLLLCPLAAWASPLAVWAIAVAEQFADGLTRREDLERADSQLREQLGILEGPWRASQGAERIALHPAHAALALAAQATRPEAPKAAYYASSNAYLNAPSLAKPGAGPHDCGYYATQVGEERGQADILRCIFGPSPPAPAVVGAEWRTPNVMAVARQIYEGRDFGALPVLADALEEAGCDDGELLDHLRGPGTHVRGCWALDLALGRE